MTAIAARRRCALAAVAVAVTICHAPVATAQSAAPSFFAGKQINLICGAAVGGGYDALARLLARHLSRHIPGNPTVIVQNMPAAGSLAASNLIANTAPRDGLTISLIQRGMLLTRLINPSAVRFDLNKLNWIGSVSSEVGLAFAWHTSAHKTAKDLFEKELIVGGHAGVDPELTPRLYNAVLGTKFKIVTGYNGTADIGLAIERGEVEGIGDWSWSSLKKQKPDPQDHAASAERVAERSGVAERAQCAGVRQDRFGPQGHRALPHAKEGGAAAHCPARRSCGAARGVADRRGGAGS
jgi:tripartite-type tricarboxylate transporter receptor subunit TctC